MNDVQLPHKLSKLVEIALADVRRTRATPGFRIEMEKWCRMDRNRCAVCAAGAVAVQRLGYDGTTSPDLGEPEDLAIFGEHNHRALLAIDALRRGSVGGALVILNEGLDGWNRDDLRADDHALSRDIVDYQDDPQQWQDDMREFAADLRGAGL